ncbi:H-NS family nucleoid-associated regulatory protein [Paraburkholderia sp. A2WS-5]|uniref:H-NS family nucleoid-associated regulatory protein n=1 Tax=unclassified Paraburkholderia TaxID=2615204 RepID=UPI003B79AAB1
MATLDSIQAKLAKLQAQATALATTKSTAVLEKIRGLMEKHSVTLADIEAFVGKRRGRKSGVSTATKQNSSVAKYQDPRSGATWTGHGRAPSWIAKAKDRSKFLLAGAPTKSAAAANPPKAGNYVRGPQPALYRDAKTGATWSGRGRAPAWLADVKDRSKFLIEKAAEPAAKKKAKTDKPVAAKKVTSTKKAAVNKAAPASRKSSTKSGAVKPVVARKARVRKGTVPSVAPVEAGVSPAATEVTGAPAAV